MIENDARIACSEARAGLHEFAAAECYEFPAHEPRDAWPGDGGDRNDLAADRRRKDRDNQQCEYEGGNGLEELRDAHQHGLGSPAIITGYASDHRAKYD